MRHGFWIETHFCFPHYVWCYINIWQKDFSPPSSVVTVSFAKLELDLWVLCIVFINHVPTFCPIGSPFSAIHDIWARIGDILWLRLCWPLFPIVGTFECPPGVFSCPMGSARRGTGKGLCLIPSPFPPDNKPQGYILAELSSLTLDVSNSHQVPPRLTLTSILPCLIICKRPFSIPLVFLELGPKLMSLHVAVCRVISIGLEHTS